MRPWMLGLATLAMIIPSAAASSGSAVMEFKSNFSVLEMTADVQQTGEDASNTRGYIDQNGNKDGQVSQGEVDAAETSFLQLMNQYGDSMSPGGGSFTLDDKDPSKFEVKSL